MLDDLRTIDARYRKTGASRYDGNPFIEALPEMPSNSLDYLRMLANRPPPPTDDLRRAGEIVRMAEMATMSDIVYPFPEYASAGIVLDLILRESYVSRNPMTVLDKQRRQGIENQLNGSLLLPKNWKPTALGHMIIAHSGMGKTTFINATLARYDQVIKHSGYEGKYLNCSQIVYVKLSIPFNGTLRSLCHEFFEQIDFIMGTQYAIQAKRLRSVAPMIVLMNQVATVCSIGLIVVDELQNLTAAKGDGAVIVLNLFSEIIEKLGISLIVLGTPAIEKVLAESVRNTRKLSTRGSTIIKSMARDSTEWNNFSDSYWKYCYVKTKTALIPEIRTAWFNACGGNTALAALAFLLAQKNSIGGREIIDKAAFDRAAAKDMGFLQPAVKALLSGKTSDLAKFDDLMFTKQFKELRDSLGVHMPESPRTAPSNDIDDFDEVKIALKPKPESKRKKKPLDIQGNIDLPGEDPLMR